MPGTFPDRFRELNHAYGQGVFFGLFDEFDRDTRRRYRYVSRAQFNDQVRAGMRHGVRIRTGEIR